MFSDDKIFFKMQIYKNTKIIIYLKINIFQNKISNEIYYIDINKYL